MTASPDTAEKVFGGRESDVSARLDALGRAVEAGRGRIAEDVLAPAQLLSQRAAERLRLSGEHTIVALAGATGSGKSSLFNALTDLELAGVGVRRPTTSWALACAWGPEGAQDLLEWMGIPARHQVSRMSMLDRSSEDQHLDGLVLLDLPDHDSTEVSHHLEMDRLVQYADLLVWVLDPQKYADAAIHDRYIRPMAAYSDVTLVVLNQIDRIPAGQRDTALADVRRILSESGLSDVTVIGVSATSGEGVDQLKRELAGRIRAKASAKTRLAADISAAAADVARSGGTHEVPGISPADREALDQALAECAGVPLVVDAIASTTRRRAARRTGWPVARWLGRLRKNPLSDLGLDDTVSMTELSRSSDPETAGVQRASAEVALRVVADKASVGLERPWRDAIRGVSTAHSDDIVDAIDRSVRDTDVHISRPALWWRVVQVLQWVGVLAVVAGLGWLLAMLVSRVADLGMPSVPSVIGVPAPLLLVIGGVVGALVLSLASRWAVRLGAARRARRVDSELRAAIDAVVQERVVAPIEAELEVYAAYREDITQALG